MIIKSVLRSRIKKWNSSLSLVFSLTFILNYMAKEPFDSSPLSYSCVVGVVLLFLGLKYKKYYEMKNGWWVPPPANATPVSIFFCESPDHHNHPCSLYYETRCLSRLGYNYKCGSTFGSKVDTGEIAHIEGIGIAHAGIANSMPAAQYSLPQHDSHLVHVHGPRELWTLVDKRPPRRQGHRIVAIIHISKPLLELGDVLGGLASLV